METTFVFDLPAMWTAISGKLLVLAVLTILDFLLGTIISIVQKKFKMEYLMHYINSDVLPILGYIAVFIITSIPTKYQPVDSVLPITEWVVYGTVFFGILASVMGHLSEIGILKPQLLKLGIGEEKVDNG